MAEISGLFGSYIWFSVIYAIVVLAYSIYLLHLNRKQAKVVDLLKETNKLLDSIKYNTEFRRSK